MMPVLVELGWLAVLNKEFEKDYMKNLEYFLANELELGNVVYPENTTIFNALDSTPFSEVKVVILGQDPYHGKDQAHGLSFSVQKGMKIPPSLKNIYKELATDIDGFTIPKHGDLSSWARQGVLLLNATLTVRSSEPGSHQNKGWEIFTDEIIKSLSEKREHLVFLLWGNFSKQKAALIDETKHFVLTAAHPSPFSAYNGFLGSKPFSKTNKLLVQNNLLPVDWNLPL